MQNTLNVDLLNANCGVGQIPAPRLPQGRRENHGRLSSLAAVGAIRVAKREPDTLGVGRQTVVRTCAVGSTRPRSSRRGLASRSMWDSTALLPSADVSLDRGRGSAVRRRRCSSGGLRERAPRCEGSRREVRLRPEFRRGYPLNLSILLSGGKETNGDSPSNGE